jgi:hypothetical protein
MEEIDVVTLEDGIEYAIIQEIKDGENNYVFLTNINDTNDFCIRKTEDTESGKMLVGLKDQEEFMKALKLFNQKN